MNIHDLRKAQAKFENQIEELILSRKELFKLRASFVKYFTYKRISSMSIDDYVEGVELPKKGYNFCYTLERKLEELGSITRSPTSKFGIYFGNRGKSRNKYQFVKKFGNTYQEAFEGVRNSLLQLLIDGEKGDLEAISKNLISPMFKGKILSTYFPNKYLNIFSDDHLNYYLIQLDLDTEHIIHADPVFKREALIIFKNQDPVMKHWTFDMFAMFLYSEYPGAPLKEKNDKHSNSDILSDYNPINFPPIDSAHFIKLNIIQENPIEITGHKTKKSTANKIDYEKEMRLLKQLGDRGEKVVMDLEIKRLKDVGKNDLAKKVERASLISDSVGFDILSFDNDGTKRFIEVKATRSKVGSANFFLSVNELKKAQESDNYFIYIVYNVTSNSPKVWPIENPFRPLNKKIVLTPINFKISIATSTSAQ